MNIFRTSRFRALAFASALPLFAALSGCDVDSTAGSTSDNAGTIYNFAGLYMNANNSETNGTLPLVFPAGRQTGRTVTWLRLLQYGSVLEGYDNASQTWSGEISGVQGGTATFSLKGLTSAGAVVDIAGTLTYASQKSTMDAASIEPSFAGSIFAQAVVSPATTNSPGTGVSVSPTSATLSTAITTQSFSASGGSGSYVWTHSGSCGTLSSTTGSSITYTRTSTGSDILTVSSGGESASASITCQ